MGKTNAQNEAQKFVKTDFLVMTDANSMLDKDAVKELMATFTSNKIAYVCGKLSIINKKSSEICQAEAQYWDSDLVIREADIIMFNVPIHKKSGETLKKVKKNARVRFFNAQKCGTVNIAFKRKAILKHNIFFLYFLVVELVTVAEKTVYLL